MTMILNPYRFSPGGGGGPSTGWIGWKGFSHESASPQTVSLTDLVDADDNPISLEENDIVVVTFANAVTDSTQAAMTPTGYTAAHADLFANDSNDTSFLVSYKVMGSTPDTDVEIPATASAWCVVSHIMVLRGIDTSNPLDVAATTATGGNSGLPNPPSITPVTTGAVITCHGASMGNSASAFTAPAQLENFRSPFRTTSGKGNVMVGVGSADWGGGAFDADAFSGGYTAGTSSWCASTIAWRPAP